ncbi:hypothetical protein ABZX65_08480 [Streptomyces sp. NPDC003300]|uniref:hypothetical protein n=1 Tax=unclassified Streptomyces TaxID=2593676 RepID=UPI0033AB2ACA
MALFFLSPLIGEFLLGNQPVTALPSVLILAPMYGGGAVLIRECARRLGRGWPTMIVLAAAYALVEEGPIDQMLWNPHYGGFDMAGAYAGTYVPFLGTSVGMIEDVLSIHTVWSVCVPIAIVETFAWGGGRAGREIRPWLGNIGLPLVAAAFVADSLFLAVAQQHSEHFMASPARLIGCGAVILVLIALAFTLPARPATRPTARTPRPWLVGATAFAATSLYWARGGLLPSGVPDWTDPALWLLAVAAFVRLALRWSRGPAWSAAHRFALAAGAVLTYAWVGFTQSSTLDVSLSLALTGSAVFALAALVLLAAAARALTRRATPGRPAPRNAGTPAGPAADRESTAPTRASSRRTPEWTDRTRR